jgi:hypothetical protein
MEYTSPCNSTTITPFGVHGVRVIDSTDRAQQLNCGKPWKVNSARESALKPLSPHQQAPGALGSIHCTVIQIQSTPTET